MSFHTTSHVTPFVFKNGARAKNRIVVPPMASSTATVDGMATSQTFAHYDKLARSGAGIVFVEYSYVDLSGRSEENQLGAHHDACVEGLAQIAKIIQSYGALAGLQITHAGGKTARNLTQGALMGASAVAVPVADKSLEVPDAMTAVQILQWKDQFKNAALRAKGAGFDIVEVHAAHGYGLNQWLSSLTNLRTDIYGESTEKSMRLLVEIISEIKHFVGPLLVAARVPGRDFLPDGLDEKDAMSIVLGLQNAGLDHLGCVVRLAAGDDLATRQGEGFLVAEASALQRVLDISVIGVGGIETALFVDEILAQGLVSFAAVGRAILKERFQRLEG